MPARSPADTRPVCLVTWIAPVEDLLGDLADQDSQVRRDAAAALDRMVTESADAIPEMARGLDHTDRIQRAAADYLVGLGPRAFPAMLARLTGPEDRNRYLAAVVLGRMEPHAAQVVPALLPALGHENPRVRALAARALGELGPAARGARHA